MPDLLKRRLQQCSDLQSVLDGALSESLELTGTAFGIVQLVDWRTGYRTLAAQRGFEDESLSYFRRPKAATGPACGRALRERHSIVIEDVLLLDGEFAFYRTVALEAGFRALQSTPLISSSGACVGCLSTQFSEPHRPLDSEMQAMKELAQLTANAIIRQRAGALGPDRSRMMDFKTVGELISSGYEAVADSYQLIRQVARTLNR